MSNKHPLLGAIVTLPGEPEPTLFRVIQVSPREERVGLSRWCMLYECESGRVCVSELIDIAVVSVSAGASAGWPPLPSEDVAESVT